jgi:hypothetical protein
MGLYENLSKMLLGLKGQKPNFEGESRTSTLHFKSSTIGDPPFTKGSKRKPSILDESDGTNNNVYRSTKGKKYTDNLPK